MAPASGDNDRRIEWTGERCVPWTDDLQVIYEHYQRYLFIASLARGGRVLDLASGEGYGTAILAAEAQSAIGVEIDADTVLHANETYGAENLRFEQGDILDLSSFEDNSFDLVVCFEALEHVEDHELLLDGITRVLRKGGVFAVSTPDRLIYTEGLGQTNPFHVHELSQSEFEELLKSQFQHIRIWGQNVSVGSTMAPLDFSEGSGNIVALAREDGGWTARTTLEPTYFVAVVSNGTLPELPAYSTLTDGNLELIRNAMRDRDAAISERNSAVQNLGEALNEMNKAMNEMKKAIAGKDEALNELDNAEKSRDEAVYARDVVEEIENAVLGGLQRSQLETSVSKRHITELRLHIEKLREEAQSSSAAIGQLRLHMAQLELSTESRRQELQEELRSLRISRQYRVGNRLYAVVERIVPVGTFRRRIAAKVAEKIRRLLSRRRPIRPMELPVGITPPVIAEALKDYGDLPILGTSTSPKASIIIPVHGGWEMTRKCLWSIASDVAAEPYEVIVVDDASPDETSSALDQVQGIRVLHLERNQGFLNAVNAGAALALGDYIVLLNNDVEVQPGWLDALVDVADLDASIGVVGGRLIYPNGFLQEAGGIIFDDATGWNYGRNMQADDPSFTFPRDVDYCSGACLLVRRNLWERVGGFDPQFAPAYYEDVDLAFAIRKTGFRVVYEPKAIVVHDEGGSYGTDESPKKSKLMEANRKTFQSKWAIKLRDHYEHSELNVRVASWRKPAGHVLVVDHQVPTFDQDAGSLRMFELLQMFNELGYAVTFIPHNKWNDQKYTHVLEDMGIEVLHGHIDFSYVIKQLSPDLRFAVLSRPDVAWGIISTLREVSPKTKIIYDTVDLHFLRLRRRAELEESGESSRLAEHYRGVESWLTNASDATIVVSEIERDLLLEEVPSARISVIPTIHESQHSGGGFDEREGLLFVGSFNHPPNRDAVDWLTHEILPIVRKSLPHVSLSIIGSNPTEEVLALHDEGVKVLGWVPDLRPYYARSRIVVAPLRYGAGIKGKICESATYGVPVVSTTIGVEGIQIVTNEGILVADTSEEFAQSIVRAYRDPDLWSKLAKNARRTIALQCSPTVVRHQLAQLLEELEV